MSYGLYGQEESEFCPNSRPMAFTMTKLLIITDSIEMKATGDIVKPNHIIMSELYLRKV